MKSSMQKHPLQKDSPSQKMGQGDISAIHIQWYHEYLSFKKF